MKKAYLILTAGILIGGTAWLSTASAAPVSGFFSRPNNGAAPQGSGCKTSVAASGLRVQVDSNLNTLGANVNVRPPIAGCTLRQTNHQSQLVTACFSGFTYPNAVVNGTAFTDADILQDCSFLGGGAQSLWYMNAP